MKKIFSYLPALFDKLYDQNSYNLALFYFFSAPKEKPCCTLPTVKKLLEEKRRRETSSLSPSCSTASTSPVPPNTVTVRPHTVGLNVLLNILSFVQMLLFMFLFLPCSSWPQQNNLPLQVQAEHLHNT